MWLQVLATPSLFMDPAVLQVAKLNFSIELHPSRTDQVRSRVQDELNTLLLRCGAASSNYGVTS